MLCFVIADRAEDVKETLNGRSGTGSRYGADRIPQSRRLIVSFSEGNRRLASEITLVVANKFLVRLKSVDFDELIHVVGHTGRHEVKDYADPWKRWPSRRERPNFRILGINRDARLAHGLAISIDLPQLSPADIGPAYRSK